MAKAKRVRWECPYGLHPAALGSTRPARDATVRFCLPCSVNAERLVPRTAPALDRERAVKTAARDARRERDRAREHDRRADAARVPVLDANGETFILDAASLLREAWATRELRETVRETIPRPQDRRVPKLTIRRGSSGKGRAAHTDDRAERARDTMSGHAKTYDGVIVLTVAPGLGHEWLRAIIAHEAAHMALPGGHHDPRWRTTYLRTVREMCPNANLPRNRGQASWRIDEEVAAAILASMPDGIDHRTTA